MSRSIAPDGEFRDIWLDFGQRGRLKDAYTDEFGAICPEGLRSVLSEVTATHTVGTTLGFCVQLASAIPLLASGGRGNLELEQIHAEVLAGRRTVALAATDGAAPGSQLSALGTTASSDTGGFFRVEGQKRWITNVWADHLLTLTRTRPGTHFTCFTWLLLDRNHAVGESATGSLPGANLGHLSIRGAQVPADRQVGRKGRALADFAVHVTRERLAGAIWAVELGTRVVDQTVERLKGRPLGEGTQWELPNARREVAERIVDLEALDALVHARQEEIVKGYAPGSAASVKVAAARVIAKTVDTCASLYGADGFEDGGLQQLRSDVALFGIGGGVLDVVLEDVIAGRHDSAKRRAA